MITDERPLLGLATTRELLEELQARFEVSGYPARAERLQLMLEQLPEGDLNYRTVDW